MEEEKAYVFVSLDGDIAKGEEASSEQQTKAI
jgi:hypothetical protein